MSTCSGISTAYSLAGTEGELISARITVEPRLLEKLLEALAEVPFPINPQIYHNAVVVYVYPDGTKRSDSTTMVEFPAYTGRLDEVRQTLESNGFSESCLHSVPMMEDIHSIVEKQPVPSGSPYSAVLRYKQSA